MVSDEISITDIAIYSATEGEGTGIEVIERPSVNNANYYNLNGQLIAQPSNADHTSTVRLKKGLYIANGHKIVMK